MGAEVDPEHSIAVVSGGHLVVRLWTDEVSGDSLVI